MYGIEFKSLCYVTHVLHCLYFGLFPGNTCRGHGDGLLRQVLSPKTVLNVV